jgi:phosphatidylserine decarboxylase
MKAEANRFILVKEGFVAVTSTAVVTSLILLASDSFFIQLFALMVLVAVAYSFRNPERLVEHYEVGCIVSVCDGIVADIETIECKGKIRGECLKVTLVNRVTDSGVLRTPFNSTFALNETQRGAQLSLASSKALKLNEQAKVMFEDASKDRKMVLKHYVNGMNTRLSLSPSLDARVDVGERYGFMHRGTVLMFLPANTRLDIKKGDELKAGESLIGFFSH